MTITDALAITDEQRTQLTDDQVRNLHPYAMAHYGPQTPAEMTTWQSDSWRTLQTRAVDLARRPKRAVQAPQQLTTASCGHGTASPMSTAAGSSCPSCYDRMAGEE